MTGDVGSKKVLMKTKHILLDLPELILWAAISNIARMVRNTQEYSGVALWYTVSDAFGVGSTTAAQMCLKAGLDPEGTIPKKGLLKRVNQK